MMRFNRNAFLSMALICFGALALAGCNTAGTNTANNTTAANGNTAVVTNKPANTTGATTPANTSATPANTTTASTGEKIGVAECDDFLEKYEACIMANVPEAGRAGFKTSMEQWRSSWKQLAANPQTKGTLANACKTTMETAKQSTSAYSCKW